jgi:hypothetical protein
MTATPQTHSVMEGKLDFSRFHQRFAVSAGIILAITGVGKLLTVTGDANILRVPDPFFGIPFQQLMLLVGLAELLVAGICFLDRWPGLSTLLVAWLASGFLVYRTGIWMIGWKKPCGCLGNLTDVLGITPKTADWIALVLLGYLLAGSYAFLFLKGGGAASAKNEGRSVECGVSGRA